MTFYPRFLTFAPMTGEAPEEPFEILPDIVRRARAFLPGWTDERVKLLAADIDKLTLQIPDRHRFSRPGEPSELGGLTLEKLAGIDSKRSEAFAVLALRFVSEAISFEQSYPVAFKSGTDPRLTRMRLAGEHLALAEGAIRYAEQCALEEIASERNRKSAQQRHKIDPKQSEKAFVRECWEQWQANRGAYSGKAAFARDMLNKCEHLKSEKVIADYCREWERETN